MNRISALEKIADSDYNEDMVDRHTHFNDDGTLTISAFGRSAPPIDTPFSALHKLCRPKDFKTNPSNPAYLIPFIGGRIRRMIQKDLDKERRRLEDIFYSGTDSSNDALGSPRYQRRNNLLARMA